MEEYIKLACTFMAFDDDEWNGKALNIIREVLDGATADQVTEMISEGYKNFISGLDRDEIVSEDFIDDFETDEDYENFLDWAQSL